MIVSAPRVTALNNRTARIRKGDKLYYFEEYTVQAIDQGDKGTNQVLVPRGKPATLQVGITIDVKVNIGNNLQTILLGLKPEIINFLRWEDYISTQSETVDKKTNTYVTNVMLPRTHEQGVSTSVAIRSGETQSRTRLARRRALRRCSPVHGRLLSRYVFRMLASFQ